jgi:hypothetical protein
MWINDLQLTATILIYFYAATFYSLI